MNKKVLIFTYYWPPAGGVAVQRFLKFSKYLPQFGWDPVIVTVQNGSYPYYDEGLLKEVLPSIPVYRTKTFEPFEFYNLLRGKKGKTMPTVVVGANRQKSLFERVTEYIRANYFIPDARKGWVPYAVKQAEELWEKEKFDAIVTTGPPHSTHLAGLQLKKKYGTKWIADLRDPWTKNLMNEFLSRTSSAIDKDERLENSVLQNADITTVISEGMKSDLHSKAKRVEVLYNGFDESDFDIAPVETKGAFTLRHVGNLILSMNVPELWQAINELRNENADLRKDFRYEIVGDAHPMVRAEFEKYNIADAVHYTGYVSHTDAVAYMKGASCLLFLASDVKHGEALISGKIFEYLASRNRVLGIGQVNGNADTLLRECDRDGIIAFRNKQKMKESLLGYYTEWQKGVRFQYTGNKHLFYSRQLQCKKLCGLLNQL